MSEKVYDELAIIIRREIDQARAEFKFCDWPRYSKEWYVHYGNIEGMFEILKYIDKDAYNILPIIKQ